MCSYLMGFLIPVWEGLKHIVSPSHKESEYIQTQFQAVTLFSCTHPSLISTFLLWLFYGGVKEMYHMNREKLHWYIISCHVSSFLLYKHHIFKIPQRSKTGIKTTCLSFFLWSNLNYLAGFFHKTLFPCVWLSLQLMTAWDVLSKLL